MSQGSSPESRQAPSDVAISLFWDDVRTGLKVVCVGLVLLLAGELSSQFRLHDFLVGATNIVGAVLVVIGLAICTAMPKETGMRPITLVTAGCAALGTLALLVYQFYPGDLSAVGKIAVVLGAVALVLVTIILRGCVTYIGHRPLIATARSLVSVAGGFAILVVVVLLIEWVSLIGWIKFPEWIEDRYPELRALVGLLALGVVGMLVYVAWGTSGAIQRVRLGQPLETPRLMLSAEYLAAEELRLARENVTYPPPPPPHFSSEQVHYFHADDAKAAGAIVVLMSGIFATGVVLYLIVAWSVAS